MIVIADTTPINYLIRIGEIEILPKLHGRILAPPSVREELRDLRAPEAVRVWIAHPPGWFEVRAATRKPDPALLEAEIETGERDAILLAQEMKAEQLIMDDMGGRREAERRHLSITGTVGALRAAAEFGLLDLKHAIDRLRRTNFHIAQSILDDLMKDPKG